MDFDPNHRHLTGSEMVFLIGILFGGIAGFSYMMIAYPWTGLVVVGLFVLYAIYGGFKFARRVFTWLKKDWNEK